MPPTDRHTAISREHRLDCKALRKHFVTRPIPFPATLYCHKLEISSPTNALQEETRTQSSPGGKTSKAVQCFLFQTISFRLNLLRLVINCKYFEKKNKIINNMDPVCLAKLVSQKFENKIIFQQFPQLFFKWMSTQNIFQAAITQKRTPEAAQLSITFKQTPKPIRKFKILFPAAATLVRSFTKFPARGSPDVT